MSLKSGMDLEKTPSKNRLGQPGLMSSAFPTNQSQSSMDADAEAPDSAFHSAYTAPPYPRPQADRDHEQELALDRERGDLTAHNLELIPNAEHVAPGIRLDRGGNDFVFHSQTHSKRLPGAAIQESGPHRDSLRSSKDDDEEDREEDEAHDTAEDRSNISRKAPSSVHATGRSSNGAAEMMDLGEHREAVDTHDHYHDDDEDEVFDEKNVNIVHERVGGSGATSENASKGTSVGHFGPRGEAIPGVPPHLDPRQPHFRPPSPSAASVVSVAVHPPASPKLHSIGVGSTAGNGEYGSSSYNHREGNNEDEETESYENGAMTPTLSDDVGDDDDELDRIKAGLQYVDASSPTPSPSLAATEDNLNPFGFARLHLGGGPQVSFSDSVMSHDLEGLSSMSRTARAPSIAATAGSSRAPSARGLSPPVSLSRATTTESSSLEEYGSTGTGVDRSGAETPSMVRSRRSSYSAPSSEVEPHSGSVGVMDAAEASTRARGATLVANAGTLLATGAGSSSSNNLHEEPEDYLRGAPSLAPSEAGSDSTRSLTQDSSSLGHGLYVLPSSGAIAVGGHGESGSSDRLVHISSSAIQAASSPGTFEAHSFSDAAAPRGSMPPTLPSLLSIKKAANRQSASTAATAGTASPPSSLSFDGASDGGGVVEQS